MKDRQAPSAKKQTGLRWGSPKEQGVGVAQSRVVWPHKSRMDKALSPTTQPAILLTSTFPNPTYHAMQCPRVTTDVMTCHCQDRPGAAEEEEFRANMISLATILAVTFDLTVTFYLVWRLTGPLMPVPQKCMSCSLHSHTPGWSLPILRYQESLRFSGQCRQLHLSRASKKDFGALRCMKQT